MAKELPDLLHSFTAEEWIGTNITPKLRHTEREHMDSCYFTCRKLRKEGLTGEEISWASRISFVMSS
jgi:hypothetical protein